MEEADISMTSMAMSDDSGDASLFVRFLREPIKDQEESLKEGRPIFREVDFIEIRQPGNKHTSIKRPTRPGDKHRFPRHWAAYQEREGQETVVGMPLADWPAVTRSEVEELRFFQIHTVEQLASVTDEVAGKYSGMHILKDKAKTYLESSGNTAAEQRLVDMEQNIAALLAENEELKKNQKKKPGRKVTSEEPVQE